MSDNKLDSLVATFVDSFNKNQFVKLTLSDKYDRAAELRNVFVKPVALKSGLQLSFIYRYPTKDIAKNYALDESLKLLCDMMTDNFMKADLFTLEQDFHYVRTRGSKTLFYSKPSTSRMVSTAEHDKVKKRYIKPEGSIYLHELGITTAEGKIKSDRQGKFRQINKYVEVIESIVQSVSLPASFRIVDMGAGKGYLTFAMYDFLTNVMNLQPEVMGVEMRQELVDNCSRIAKESGFGKLSFEAGSIDTKVIGDINMLIALHACDIATDQAIYRGILAESEVIICAPCCHRQIRKQFQPTSDLDAISKYGILEERQAEILTDTIRALILEAYGYKTKVFEFISTEHTPKNVMIVGIRSKIDQKIRDKKLKQVKNLKVLFGVEYHHLERLLGLF